MNSKKEILDKVAEIIESDRLQQRYNKGLSRFTIAKEVIDIVMEQETTIDCQCCLDEDVQLGLDKCPHKNGKVTIREMIK